MQGQEPVMDRFLWALRLFCNEFNWEVKRDMGCDSSTSNAIRGIWGVAGEKMWDVYASGGVKRGWGARGASGRRRNGNIAADRWKR